jgi:hypothetical protein
MCFQLQSFGNAVFECTDVANNKTRLGLRVIQTILYATLFDAGAKRLTHSAQSVRIGMS